MAMVNFQAENPVNDNETTDVIPPSEYKGIEFVSVIVTDFHITIRLLPFGVQLACDLYDKSDPFLS